MLSKRKSLIENEKSYLDFLKSKIPDEENQKHFCVAVEWRHQRAELYRKWYYSLQWLQALCSLAIVVLGVLQSDALGNAIAVVGGISALVLFALSLYKFYDSWKRYRDSLEDIKALTRIYISKNLPFGQEQSVDNKLYILKLDKIILGETKGWKHMRDNRSSESDDETT